VKSSLVYLVKLAKNLFELVRNQTATSTILDMAVCKKYITHIGVFHHQNLITLDSSSFVTCTR